MDRYPLGDQAILDFTLSSGGVGVVSQPCKIIIQRLSDNYFFDETQPGDKFQPGYYRNNMTEVGPVNQAGLYRYFFNHLDDTQGSEYFWIRREVTTGDGGSLDRFFDDIIAFGPLRTAEAPSTCSVYGTIVDSTGQAEINKQVRASILQNTILDVSVSPAKPGVSVDRIDVYTDNQGDFAMTLVQGITVRLQIPALGYDRKVTIPGQSSVNFADL